MALADSVAAVNPELDVGSRLRELRVQRGLSLRKLGETLGISASSLSQIETGRMRPSVTRLHQIVNALGASLSAVFDDADSSPSYEPGRSRGQAVQGVRVQRSGEASELDLEGGIRWLRLPPDPEPGIDLLKIEYPVGSGSESYLRHAGRETAHVLSGELTFDIGFDGHYTVDAGDSISYASTTPHRVTNQGDEVAVVIWLVIGAESGTTGHGTVG